jgi:hypothetical protein
MTLETLRRRRQAVAKTVLPVLVAVWLNAAAWPCPAMTLDAAFQDRSAAEAPQADAAQNAHHGQGASDADRHGHCPHCGSKDGSGHPAENTSHIACSASDDLAGQSERSVPNKAKLALLQAPIELPRRETMRARGLHSPAHPIPPASIALNLRYCVFLN